MDPSQFEDLSRRFARDLSRRGLTRATAGAATLFLGAAGLTRASSEVGEEGIAVYHCKIPGQKCKKDVNCCSRTCRKKVCSCKKQGQPCAVAQEGGICCSKICKEGKCA